MVNEKTPYARWAWKVIEAFVNRKKIPLKPDDIELPEGSYQRKAGVFVTVHRRDGSLRGCIGTFLPTQPCIVDEIRENAIAAVSRDPRFFPVTPEELQDLICSVDILSEPTIVRDIGELDPKKYGVIVEGRFGRGALGTTEVDLTDNRKNNISVLDEAMNRVSDMRSNTGAIRNRLTEGIRNLEVGYVNQIAAESSIRDADIAQNIMNLAKKQILSRAATLVLVNQNINRRNVLSLLMR